MIIDKGDKKNKNSDSDHNSDQSDDDFIDWTKTDDDVYNDQLSNPDVKEQEKDKADKQ